MATDIVTFPPAICVITFEAVPPGQQPTSIIPSARSVFKRKTTANNQAARGITVN